MNFLEIPLLPKFQFLIFLAFLIIEFPWPAIPETLLTKGNETVNNVLDTNEPLWKEWIVVKDYNRMDQCMRQEEFEHIMSFSIVLRMTENEMNLGQGLTICYVGQLDGKNKDDGLVPSILQRVTNKKGNYLMEICEKARKESCKDMAGAKLAECKEFTKFPWHGINFASDENGTMTITLSTSNQKLIIPHAYFYENGGKIFIKLTRWNDLTTIVSKKQGPGYVERKFRPYSAWDEKANRILGISKASIENRVHRGTPLSKFFSLWTLAPDILPHFEGETTINLYIIRSKCSELGATFLLPTNNGSRQLIPLNNTAMKLIPITSFLKHNNVAIFRGKVHPDAKWFTITLENSIDVFDQPFKGIRMVVEFTDANIGTVHFEEMRTNNEIPWTKVDQIHTEEEKHVISFKRGQNFMLKSISMKKDFVLSLNCGENITYSRGSAQIEPNNMLKTEIKGDVDIFNVTGTPPSAAETTENRIETFITVDIPWKFNEGIVLIAKLNTTWDNFTFDFTKKNKDDLCLRDRILKVDIQNHDEKFRLYLFKDKEDVCQKYSKSGKCYIDKLDTLIPHESGSIVEFTLKLRETQIEFLVNDTEIFEITDLQEQPEVDIIQVIYKFKFFKNLSSFF